MEREALCLMNAVCVKKSGEEKKSRHKAKKKKGLKCIKKENNVKK